MARSVGSSNNLSQHYGNASHNISYQLWVGNIPFDSTEGELKSVLSLAGRVLNIRIKYDVETGKNKGFAFVEYPDADTCQIALWKLHLKDVRGRKIRLDWATDELRELYGGGTGGPKNARERRDRQDRIYDKFGDGHYFMGGTPSNKRSAHPYHPQSTSLISSMDPHFSLPTMKHPPSGFSNQHSQPHPPHINDIPLSSSFTMSGDKNSYRENEEGKGGVEGYRNGRHHVMYNNSDEGVPYGSDEMYGRNVSYNRYDNTLQLQIIETVQSLTTAQLLYIVGHFQKLIAQNPDDAIYLLSENTPVAYALLHIMFLLDVTTEKFLPLTSEQLHSAEMNKQERQAQLQNAGIQLPKVKAYSAAAAVPPPASIAVPEHPVHSYKETVVTDAAASSIEATPQPYTVHSEAARSTDLPPSTAPPTPSMASDELIDQLLIPENEETLRKVVAVTPEYIETLPEGYRQQILEIQAALRHRGYMLST